MLFRYFRQYEKYRLGELSALITRSILAAAAISSHDTAQSPRMHLYVEMYSKNNR